MLFLEAHLTQHRNMIDSVIVGQWTYKAIAQARLSYARLSLILFDATQTNNCHIDCALHGFVALGWALNSQCLLRFKWCFVFNFMK